MKAARADARRHGTSQEEQAAAGAGIAMSEVREGRGGGRAEPMNRAGEQKPGAEYGTQGMNWKGKGQGQQDREESCLGEGEGEASQTEETGRERHQ